MPKPLREPQPTSSVARLLSVDAAARATARPPASVANGQGTPPKHAGSEDSGARLVPLAGERPTIKRELVLTRTADTILTRLTELYRDATQSKLTTSHLVRAILKAVEGAIEPLKEHAAVLGPLQLPSNARGRELERERFEARITAAFLAGMRGGDPVDPHRMEALNAETRP